MKGASHSLTTKQTWVLSTVALSQEGVTKYNLEHLWLHTLLPRGHSFLPTTNHDSFNMRKTLDSLVKVGLLKKVEGKKGITLYHVGSWIPGLWSAAQPYKPYSRKVMTYLSNKYLEEHR